MDASAYAAKASDLIRSNNELVMLLTSLMQASPPPEQKILETRQQIETIQSSYKMLAAQAQAAGIMLNAVQQSAQEQPQIVQGQQGQQQGQPAQPEGQIVQGQPAQPQGQIVQGQPAQPQGQIVQGQPAQLSVEQQVEETKSGSLQTQSSRVMESQTPVEGQHATPGVGAEDAIESAATPKSSEPEGPDPGDQLVYCSTSEQAGVLGHPVKMRERIEFLLTSEQTLQGMLRDAMKEESPEDLLIARITREISLCQKEFELLVEARERKKEANRAIEEFEIVPHEPLGVDVVNNMSPAELIAKNNELVKLVNAVQKKRPDGWKEQEHSILTEIGLLQGRYVEIAPKKEPLRGMSGELLKVGKSRKSWRHRWFVLQGMHLKYYTSKKMSDMKGDIRLSPDLKCDPLLSPKHGMTLETPGRTYKFVATNDNVRDQWMNNIRKHIAASRRV